MEGYGDSEQFDGYCPICESKTSFRILGPWLRDELKCTNCNSIPRERALAFVLTRTLPDWRNASIHESSPADRGISAKLKSQCIDYVASQYYPKISQQKVGEYFNINLESQTFEDKKFDVFIALDVFEHILNPKAATQEIYRTLKDGGVAILTFPIIKSLVLATDFRVKIINGNVEYLKPIEYHGNPIDESGSLVTVDYGYDIHKEISLWAKFETEVVRFNRRDIGVLGEFTEVVILQK